jgi:hypothetical protein
MAHYLVKTQSSVNEMLLHSTMQREFTTDNLDEAKVVFAKECEALASQYVTADAFEYSPSDYEVSHAIFCEIIELVYDEDGEVGDIVSIETSDYYYER